MQSPSSVTDEKYSFVVWFSDLVNQTKLESLMLYRPTNAQPQCRACARLQSHREFFSLLKQDNICPPVFKKVVVPSISELVEVPVDFFWLSLLLFIEGLDCAPSSDMLWYLQGLLNQSGLNKVFFYSSFKIKHWACSFYPHYVQIFSVLWNKDSCKLCTQIYVWDLKYVVSIYSPSQYLLCVTLGFHKRGFKVNKKSWWPLIFHTWVLCHISFCLSLLTNTSTMHGNILLPEAALALQQSSQTSWSGDAVLLFKGTEISSVAFPMPFTSRHPHKIHFSALMSERLFAGP